jgi:hypothetical protein
MKLNAWRLPQRNSGEFDEPGTEWYTPGMTETVTIRLRRSKSELLKKSGGNLNRWLNGLIDQALDEPVPDWDAHFRRPRRKFRYTADQVRKAGR